MADVDSKAAEKAKKVAAAKKKLAAYRKSKKPKASSPLVEGDEISDTTSEASYSVSSDVASIISVDDRSTPDNEKLDETIVRPEESSALQKQLQVCYNRMAELEEMVDGKSAALVSLSEENARLSTELSSYKQNGSVNGDTTPNKPHENGDGIDVQQLTAHLQQYRAAVAQRDQALQQLLEQNRLLQEQNRQLQTPSRSASEDGLDYAAETESLKMRVSLLSEQLEQANATLARQSAPSPQPILDAKEEIISLQQTLAAQEQALLHLKSVVSEKDRELDLLKSDITEKDLSIQALGVKISKKSEVLSELTEELDLFKAKDSENMLIINELKNGQSKSPDAAGSDADSVASGAFSEEEVEEKQQALRDMLDEQFGQNMMAMKESMSRSHEENQNALKKELQLAREQITNWETWGKNAQLQFQQQLQQQLAALNHQLVEKHKAELEQASAAVNGVVAHDILDDEIERLRSQHEEEMKVLVDTAEEEANSLKDRIAQLEETLKQSAPPTDNDIDTTQRSQELLSLKENLTEALSQLEELKRMYQSSQDQVTASLKKEQDMSDEMAQLSQKVNGLQDEKEAFQSRVSQLSSYQDRITSEKDSLTSQLNLLNSELDQLQGANSEMSSEVESLRERCAQLASTNEQVEHSNKEAEALNSQHVEKIHSLENENTEIKADLEALKSQSTQQQDAQNDTTELVKQERDSLQLEVDELRSQNNSLLAQVEDIQCKSKEIEERQLDEAEKVKQERDNLQSELDDLKLQNESLQKQFEDAQHTANEMEGKQQNDVAQVKLEKENLQSEFDRLKMLNASLSAQVDDIQCSARDTESELQEQISQLTHANNSLQTDLSTLKEQVAFENEKLSMNEHLAEEIDILKQNNSELMKQLSEVRANNDSLISQTSTLENLQTQLESVQAAYELTLKDVDNTKQEQARLSEALDSKSKECEQVSVKYEEAFMALEDKSKQLALSSEEVTNLSSELKEVKLAYEQVSNQHDETSNELENTSKLLEEKARQLEKVTNDLTNVTSEMDKTTRAYELLSSQQADTSNHLQQTSKQLDEKSSELENALKELEKVSEDLLTATNISQLASDQYQSKCDEFTAVSSELEKVSKENQLLQEEKLRQLQELASSDAVRDELTALTSENQSLKEQLAEHDKLVKNFDHLKADLETANENISKTSAALELANEKLLDYDRVTSNLESLSAETSELKERLATSNSSLDDAQARNQSLVDEISEANATAQNYEQECSQLSAALEELKSSSQTAFSDLKNNTEITIKDLQDRITKLQDENASLAQTSQLETAEYEEKLAKHGEEIADYLRQLEQTKTELAETRQQSALKADELTHSFDDEVMLLNFQIKDLQAKLDDVKSADRQDFQDDINVAVQQALRDQKAQLSVEYEGLIAKVKEERGKDIEMERKQVEISYEQKFIKQMQDMKSEFEKQKDKELNELQQALTRDMTGQLQTAYNTIQEKERMLATLNKELSQTQDVNERLSEETMALEELRKDKENLQAQLDKVQGELEDFDRVSSPTVLADQERLLRENPTMTDQVEDSGKYQSLVDENEQLKIHIEQFRDSDAGKLKIDNEQLKQENQALRGQLDSSLIPDRGSSFEAAAESNTEEINALKQALINSNQTGQEIAERYKALHSQYTQMEEHYKQALVAGASANNEILSQEVKTLSESCQNYEARIEKLLQDMEVLRAERDTTQRELDSANEQLTATPDTFQMSQENPEPEVATESSDKLQTKVLQLQGLLDVSNADMQREKEAHSSTQNELETQRKELSLLSQTVEDLREKLVDAERRLQQPVHEVIVQSHSTPVHARSNLSRDSVELYETSQQRPQELSDDVSKLREDMNSLQEQYNKDTTALKQDLDEERKNVEELRQEMRNSLNSSTQSTDASYLANLTDIIANLQATNDKLNSEKQDLNKHLMEQEKLCQKLHERIGASEALSNGVQESYSKQLAAAQAQRDKILQQLEEACKVNDQVTHLVTERNALQQERSDVKEKLRERDDLELELLKMKAQLDSLTHSHNKMSENLVEKDQAGLELSRRNAILESAVQQMEMKLKQSEEAFVSERQLARERKDETALALKTKSEVERRFGEEKASLRSKLTVELQQTRAACEKNHLLQIRQERLDAEEKYTQAIAKLRQDLAEESRRKVESLKTQHTSQLSQQESQHKKQLAELNELTEKRIEELKQQLSQQQSLHAADIKQEAEKVKNQEIKDLQAKFEKECESIRSDMDTAHQAQFDDMMKMQMKQVEKERMAAQAAMEEHLERLRMSLEQSHADELKQFSDRANIDKAHALETLRHQLDAEHVLQVSTLREELDVKLRQALEDHQIMVDRLQAQHRLEISEAKFDSLDKLVKNHELQLKAVEERHKEELSALTEQFTQEKQSLLSEHSEQLKTARAQLVISRFLEQDYQQLRSDLDRLKMEKDINSNIMKQLEAERDALLQQAVESREKITAVHDEEMSELREFFEEKLLITEQSYNEELTMLREQHELELLQGNSPRGAYSKPYHTGDSMTESLQAKEREKSRVYHTMTVLSDLESSEGSPPRLSLGDMEDSIVKEKSQRISELESEIEDLTAKVVKAENHFEQQKSLAETLSKEKEALVSELNVARNEMLKLAEQTDKNEQSVAELKNLHQKEMEMEKASLIQLAKDIGEKHSEEIAKCKFEIASITGHLIEKEALLNEAYHKAAAKQDELKSEFKQTVSDLCSTHEQQMSSQLSQLRESMEAEHAVALEQLTQRLQDSKQQSVDALAEQHSAQITELNSEIGSLKSQMEAVKADHTDSLNQLQNEYKIVLDAVQSEKQEVEDSLMKVTEEYSSLKNSLENDEALALVSLRQDLESLHKEEMNELRSEYDTAIASLTERHQEEVAQLQVDIEAQSNELLKESLEQKQADVKAVIKEYEAKVEETQAKMRQEYDMVLEEMRLQCERDIETEKQALASRLEEAQGDYDRQIKSCELQVVERFQKAEADLKEHQSTINMLADEIQTLEADKTYQSGVIEQLKEKYRVDLDEAQQKADDLDAAHVEELKILADEHDLQLQQLRDKLASQLDAMSTELSDLQANHEGELLQLRAAHNKLMEEALLEQHNNTEQDILLRNEAMESEREAWEAEREAHEAEVQALEHQINLERQEYKSKVEAHSSVVKDLEKQLLNERTLAKETSSIWIDKMSELQTEQEHRNQEYKDSLSDIEKTYQKQIDSLKEHLQRIVTESHQKDDLIEQLKAEKAKLQDQISTSSDSKDLISQLQVDLDHLKQEKESIGATNQKLLELLSNNVETHRSLESHILKRIGPVDGFSQSGRSTPVNRPQRPNSTAGNGNVGGASNIGGASNMGGASSRGDASTPTPHEKSFDSEMADEGLDLSHMSHTREASMFVGPSLQFSEEETVIESGRHLQEVVDMLLSRIENVNAELEEARREQVEIFQKLSDKTTQVTTLESELKRSDAAATEIGEQLDQALEENTYLKSSNGQQQEVVTELQHSESDLSQELSETKEKLESLEKQYAIIQSDLLTLQNERDAVEEMKRHVEMQYQALSNDATESESQLITLNSQLATEKVQIQSEYESRVTEYEEKLKSLEEQLLESAKERDSKVNALLSQQRDLELMVESLEKNLNRDKQFYEQQTMERETERDEHASVANLLKETLDKCKSQEELIADLQLQLSHTVEELHSTAISQIAGAQESLDQSQLTRAELDDKDDTIADMKKMMDSLEAELQTSIHRESDLRQKLDSLQKTSQVDQTTYEEPPQLTQHNVISELSERLEESLKAIQILKEERDNLTDQMEALKNLSEEYMQEKATLQNSVYEHLNDISMLKSQLEALRHQSSSKPGETSRAEALVEELHVLQDKLERKDEELAALTERLLSAEKSLAHHEDGEKLNMLELQQVIEQERERSAELEEAVTQLQKEAELHKQSSQTASVDDLLRELMAEKDEEIKSLQESLKARDLPTREELEELNELLSAKSKEAEETETRLTREISDMKQDLSAKVEEIVDQKQRLSSLSEQNEELEGRVQQLSLAVGDVEQLNRKYSSKSDEADELALSVATKSAKIEELQTLLNAQIEDNKSLENFSAVLSEDFEQIQSMVESKDTEVTQLQASLDKQEEANVALRDEKEALEQQVMTLKKDLRESQNVVNEKEEEMYMLNERVEEMEKKQVDTSQLSQEKEKLLAESKNLVSQIESHKAELEKSRARIEELEMNCKELGQELSAFKEQSEDKADVSKSELDAMISEKIELALQLDKARQDTRQLNLVVKEKDSNISELTEQLRATISEKEALSSVIETHSRQLSNVQLERDSLVGLEPSDQLEQTTDATTFVAGNNTSGWGSLLQTTIKEDTQLDSSESHLQPSNLNEELQRVISERDTLLEKVSSLHAKLNNIEQTPVGSSHIDALNSLTCEVDCVKRERNELKGRLEAATDMADKLMEEKTNLQKKLANSHDAKDVDERLAKLQHEMEIQLKQKSEELEALSQSAQEELKSQQESYEETILALNEKIKSLRTEFEQNYQKLKEQVLDEVVSKIDETMPEESFSESLRRDIEGKIALITNGYQRDSDQDTIPDTSSQLSTIGDDVPVHQRQKHHMDQIERVSSSIYKLSQGNAAFSERVVESLLQEKEVLQASVQSLKDMLSHIDSARSEAISTVSHPPDWRASLIQAIHQVFVQERELYLQELRTFVAARGDLQPNEAERMESRLRSLSSRQESSLDELFRTDRQSLLDEIAEHRSLLNKMKEDVLQICTQLEKSKADAKQEAELNEARQLQQAALIADMSKALNAEQQRNGSLTGELSTLREKLYKAEADLANTTAQLDHSRHLLDTEQQKFSSLQNQLANESEKTEMLESRLHQQAAEEQKLRCGLEKLQQEKKQEKEEAHLLAQTLRQDIQLLRDKQSGLTAKLDKESLQLQTAKRQLVEEQNLASNRERKAKAKISQLELNLDMEKANQLDLSQQLSQEKRLSADQAKQISELENRPTVSEYKMLADELDTEKGRCLDMQSAVSREKNRSANLSAALDLARAQALEEIENEKRLVSQLKQDLESRKRESGDLRAQLLAENQTVGTLREEVANLQDKLENVNCELFAAQRELAVQQTSMQQIRDSMADVESFNDELKTRLGAADALVAEKERVIASQHRDIVKMRNHTAQANIPPSSSESIKLLDLVDKLSQEKSELRNTLSHLEAEIHQYKIREANRTSGNSSCKLSSYWLDVVTQLYSRMRKAEAKVRGLTYQKKLILLQLGGYQECEAETLRRLANMGAVSPTTPTKIPPKRRFRAAVRVVITTYRMKWLIARSKTLIRDGIQSLFNNDKENSGHKVANKPSKSESKSDSAKISRPDFRRSSRRPDSSRTASTTVTGSSSKRPSSAQSARSDKGSYSASRPQSQSSLHRRRSSKGSSREDMRSSATASPVETLSRRSTPRNSPVPPREGQTGSPASSYNPSRHANCFPPDAHIRPAVNRPSADDSVVENLNRLERLQERLTEIQKPSSATPDAFM